MKNVVSYIAILTLILGLGSCSDFLDRDSSNEISQDDLYKTVEGAEMALTGLYSKLSDYSYLGQNMLVVPEFKSGNIKFNPALGGSSINRTQFVASYEFSHVAQELDSDDDVIHNFYQYLYDYLYQANNIIEKVPGVPTSNVAKRDQILGEALAIRAMLHFDLTRLYAQPYIYGKNGRHWGVVNLTQNISFLDQPARARLYENYDQIIEDLTLAIDLMKAPRKGSIREAYFSAEAAKALLARVYLYKGDWLMAKEYADQVIKSGAYRLTDNWNLVMAWQQSQPSMEDIFMIDLSNMTSALISEIYGIESTGVFQNGQLDVVYKTERAAVATSDLLALYDEGDVRLQLFANSSPTNADSPKITRKFSNASLKERFTPVIRLAEIYLIRAEASAELGQNVQARSDLNTIRKRANPNASNIISSGEALIEEIMKERRRELCFEGHTYFDLIRKGKGIVRPDFNGAQNGDVEFPSDLLVLPIRQKALDYNENLIQNPGY